ESEIRVVLNDGAEDFKGIREIIKVGKIPSNYKGVLSNVESILSEGNLEIRARFVPQDNTEGRTQNEDKLFNSVFKSAIKPLLDAVYESTH
ncbi:MAG: hypothetical protein KC506_03050, partial [Nanoarchaeota archaeon]|nr:hypothetical protein [Nanoarchaeota archaeon]